MWWKKWTVFVMLPLFFGAFIYWTARGDSPPLFLKWFYIPLAPFNLSPYFPKIIIDHSPSFFWSFALAMSLFLLWNSNNKKTKFILGSVAFIFSVLYEYLQKINIVSGTFDWGDIYASGLAIGLAYFFFKKTIS